MTKLIQYIFNDLLRTRFTIVYTIFLLVSTFAMFQLDSDPGKVVMSLLNIMLIVVPLVSIIFTTIHFYNSREFIELMLAQPVDRSVIFLSEYIAVGSSLCAAFLFGAGVPILLFGATAAGLMLLFVGVTLTLVFVSLAFLAAVLTRDKAKAIGIGLLFWFYFTLIYDGLVLWILFSFGDYPLESVTLFLISLNPVDLARVIMLLKLDNSALMGYTGAFYRDFFGSFLGIGLSTAVLALWIVAPIYSAMRIFRRKDL